MANTKIILKFEGMTIEELRKAYNERCAKICQAIQLDNAEEILSEMEVLQYLLARELSE